MAKSHVFSVEALAERWNVALSTVYKALRAGRIPSLRVGARYVIPRSAIEELERNAAQCKPASPQVS